MSLAVHKEMRSVHASATICKPKTWSKDAASKTHRPDKFTDPRLAAEAEAETEFATQGAGAKEEGRFKCRKQTQDIPNKNL
jgi:hypothetical protein